MATNETWLTIRVRASHHSTALALLDSFCKDKHLEPALQVGDDTKADSDAGPLVYHLRSGSYGVGTAIVGVPGGGEFDAQDL